MNLFARHHRSTHKIYRLGHKFDVGIFSSHQYLVVATPDRLALTETSLAWWDELFPVQDGLNSFLLASVNFNVTSTEPGLGSLNFTRVAFGAGFGDAFTEVSHQNKAYLVTSGSPVNVPEPTAIVLLLMGLLLLVRQKQLN